MGNSTQTPLITPRKSIKAKNLSDEPGVMASLPRRDFIELEPTDVTPPMMKPVSYTPGFIEVIKGLSSWLAIGFSYGAGIVIDWLGRNRSESRRATQFRKSFEKKGGAFRKIGLLLAMRIDIFPWSYCVELSQIIDHMSPFPFEQAIQAITNSTGRELSQTFEKFDPEPIQTTAIACAYQAYLKDGKKVVIKVRRPDIGKVFMANIKALGIILNSLEFLSIIRPTFTKNLQRELRETIQDELNFTLEARHQALFRDEAKKSGKKFFTAPRVYFELCSQSVIVRDFTTGMWLWELLAAVEQNDQDAQERARELNIDPAKVARRLLWVNFWGMDEHMLFRADLHSDNIIIRKNSKLTFIDFSSIGSLTQEKRRAVQRTMLSAWKKDPLEMARESMILLEPLPPIDTIKYTKDLESTYWQFLYAMESEHTQWWERTSARLWLGFVRVAREHNVIINIHVLRMIRSCLLHDTIATRLSEKVDHIQEYQRFSKYRAKAARKRVEERLLMQMEGGLGNRIFLQVEELVDTSEKLFRQLQRFLSAPTLKFNAVLGKSAYSLSILFKMLGQWALIIMLGLTLFYGYEWLTKQSVHHFSYAITQVASNGIFQLAILFSIIINVRSMLYRLSDKEI